jgi:hypothetical protein
MRIDFAGKHALCFGIGVLWSLMLSPSAIDGQPIIGPCIQFLDKDGKPTHEGLKCDFSADSMTVKFFGGGSVRFTVNGVTVGNPQPSPAMMHEFKATFAGGTITGFTWTGQGKPPTSAVLPPGATDLHFTSESGLSPVKFSTNGFPDTTTRPPLTTVEVEMFLTKQP